MFLSKVILGEHVVVTSCEFEAACVRLHLSREARGCGKQASSFGALALENVA